ncbi:MAG TPA: GyrI-like domain-containing protein [Bacillaceae bacterium]
MKENTIAAFKCEIVQKEFKLVGQSITANFPDSFPDAAMKIQMEFEKRRSEVPNARNKEVLFSPYMCNDIIATYFACLEVEEIDAIPEGMIGFTLPVTKYAKIQCSNKTIGEGYNHVFSWMQENGYKQKWLDRSCPIEIFYLEDNAEEEVVEILIPIM